MTGQQFAEAINEALGPRMKLTGAAGARGAGARRGVGNAAACSGAPAAARARARSPPRASGSVRARQHMVVQPAITRPRAGEGAALQQFVDFFAARQLPKGTRVVFVWPLAAPGKEAVLSAALVAPGEAKDLEASAPEVRPPARRGAPAANRAAPAAPGGALVEAARPRPRPLHPHPLHPQPFTLPRAPPPAPRPRPPAAHPLARPRARAVRALPGRRQRGA